MRTGVFATLSAVLVILFPSQAKSFEPTSDQLQAGLIYAYWQCKWQMNGRRGDQFSTSNRELGKLGLLDDWEKVPADEVFPIYEFWLRVKGGFDDKRALQNPQLLDESLNAELERSCRQLVNTRNTWFDN